jgi:hypothetical protein
MDATTRSYYVETAYGAALELVAIGETRADTKSTLKSQWPALSTAELETLLHDAKVDAENQGVERDDIDDSWYR